MRHEPAIIRGNVRQEIVSPYKPSVEELRLFRYVSVRQDHGAVWARTTNPDVAALYDHVYYRRAPDLLEYEVVFGPWAVEAALEVMKERE